MILLQIEHYYYYHENVKSTVKFEDPTNIQTILNCVKSSNILGNIQVLNWLTNTTSPSRLAFRYTKHKDKQTFNNKQCFLVFEYRYCLPETGINTDAQHRVSMEPRM